MTDEDISEKAVAYAQKHKKNLAKKYTDKDIYPPESHPISVFMAGSPGAGKTESARELIRRLSNNNAVLRTDPDDLREEFENYDGKNSSLFQGATSIIVDRMHDLALKQKQSFVFDGTLTNLDRAIENIERSLKKEREVYILYVYQDPIQAWKFVKKRAEKDGRVVPKEAFISQYFTARQNVNAIKEQFKKDVQVDIIVKDIDGTNLMYRENIDRIDNHIKEKYSEDTLREVIVE